MAIIIMHDIISIQQICVTMSPKTVEEAVIPQSKVYPSCLRPIKLRLSKRKDLKMQQRKLEVSTEHNHS